MLTGETLSLGLVAGDHPSTDPSPGLPPPSPPAQFCLQQRGASVGLSFPYRHDFSRKSNCRQRVHVLSPAPHSFGVRFISAGGLLMAIWGPVKSCRFGKHEPCLCLP